MRRFFSFLLPLVVLLLFSFKTYQRGFYLHPGLVKAADDGQSADITDIQNKINRLTTSLEETRQKKATLSNQISYMDGRIRLTSLKIKQTLDSIVFLEGQIGKLSEKIGKLDVSLNNLSVVFLNRVVATYKTDRTNSFLLVFSSKGFSNLFRRWGYFRALQLNDRKIMLSLEETRVNYSLQKEEKEKKQAQLEKLKRQLADQKASLEKQKKDKEYLLEITRSNERRYQQLLAKAMAEMSAIQQVIAGKGQETKVGEVSAGEQIATIIPHASPCSSGAHLHFEVHDGGAHRNPANYLKTISLNYDYDTKAIPEFINSSGSWNWPLNEPIYVHQIYGKTAWIRVLGLWYNFHTGIDISSRDGVVKSVADGTLYDGSIKCGGGYLRYTRVKHKNSSISTYYLHINYTKV